MRRLVPLAVVALVVVAAPAAAKQVKDAKVCGASGCVKIGHADETMLMGGPGTTGPSDPRPFVRFEFRLGVPGHYSRITTLFVPSAGLIVNEGSTWMRAPALALLGRIARRVTPFPASAFPKGWLPAPPRVHHPAAVDTGGGLGDWWIALVGGPLALALGLAMFRRRRHVGPAAA